MTLLWLAGQNLKNCFSHTLKNVDWKSAKLANRNLEEEVLEPNSNRVKDIFIEVAV